MSYITCIIEGRVGKDPDSSFVSNNTLHLARFSVAVDVYEGKEKGKRTMWVDVTAFGKTADLVVDYVKKGDNILVQGRPEPELWKDKQGEPRVSFKLAADRVSLIGRTERKGEGKPGQGSDRPAAARPGGQASTPKPEQRQLSEQELDDLPF